MYKPGDKVVFYRDVTDWKGKRDELLGKVITITREVQSYYQPQYGATAAYYFEELPSYFVRDNEIAPAEIYNRPLWRAL
jgi:hypothetical protein